MATDGFASADDLIENMASRAESPAVPAAGMDRIRPPLRIALPAGIDRSPEGLARQRVEERLREQAALLNLAHDAIMVVDLRGKVLFWNRGAEDTFGWPAEDALGQPIHEFLQTRFPVSLETINAQLRERGQWEGELTHRKRDGAPIVVASRWSLQRDEYGAPKAFLQIDRDITERKRAEDQIRQLNEKLELRVQQRTAELQAANKELEAFSYSVSHDLRAPLRGISSFSQILLRECGPQLSTEARHYLEVVACSAMQMGRLIEDILAFSRLGRQPVKRQPVQTVELVRQALEDLRAERDGRQVEIVIGDLPPCEGDPQLLKQVFVNLLSNALKYTRLRQPARIEVTTAPGACAAGQSAVYCVRDNGVGFDMRFADKLFGVFQRLHRADEYEGSGVGLAIVQGIIHRHGGRVWAEAAVDRGAAFYFTVAGC
jgi:PAS domain S-box-containing protein